MILIDAGHGGPSDRGARYGGFDEADLNLRQAREIYAVLTALGHSAELIRDDDLAWTLTERAELAAALECTVAIVVHHNAGPAELHGPLFFHWPRDVGGRRVAETIARCMPDPLYCKGSRVWVSDRSARWLQRPSAVLRPYAERGISALLIEVGYMSNADDLAAVMLPAVRRGVSLAVACGLHPEA